MAFDGDWEKREKEEQSSRRWMLGFAIFLWVGGLMWLTTPLVVFGLITILAGFWPFSGYWKAKKEYEERNEHKQKMMDAFCKAQKQVVVPQRRDLICEGTNAGIWEKSLSSGFHWALTPSSDTVNPAVASFSLITLTPSPLHP